MNEENEKFTENTETVEREYPKSRIKYSQSFFPLFYGHIQNKLYIKFFTVFGMVYTENSSLLDDLYSKNVRHWLNAGGVGYEVRK